MKMPKSQPQQPTPPAPMPDPMSPAVMEAKRKKSTEMMNRAGRASTILSQANQGQGGDFSAQKLG